LKRAVQIAPFNLVAWGYLALAYAWTGQDNDVAEARTILDRLLRTAPDHPSVPYWLFFKSSALTRQGMIADAAESALASTTAQPHFFLSRIAYANALGMLGQLDRARAEIERVTSGHPGVTPEIYAESVNFLSRTADAAANHLAGLRAAGWMSA
jgi:predicted Zn-dependent protease